MNIPDFVDHRDSHDMSAAIGSDGNMVALLVLGDFLVERRNAVQPDGARA